MTRLPIGRRSKPNARPGAVRERYNLADDGAQQGGIDAVRELGKRWSIGLHDEEVDAVARRDN